VSESSAVIHVVDDDDAFRTAIGRQLKTAGYRVKEYAGAAEFLMDPPDEGEASCVLLDLNLPGPSGLDLQEAMVKRGGSLPVIFLTGQGDVRQSVRAMRQGAVDFLEKPIAGSELLAAVREALGRQAEHAEASSRRRELARRFARLTVREREVFDDVVAGRLSKQIASRLGISERTIKAHRSRIMTKMEVSSLAELGRAAAELPDRPPSAGGPAK
jgi:RNA polymerase sigma factor (sigma-70 family)